MDKDMNEIREKATKGNKMIEDAIIKLLEIHKDGLEHSQIVKITGLSSSHNGAQKNYLTYSILGNLMDRDIIIKEGQGKEAKYKLSLSE